MFQPDPIARRLHVFVWTLAILLAATIARADDGAASVAPAEGDGETVRLFTIGNSFSYNSTRYLRQLAEAGGHEVVLGTAALGGASLQRHWTQVEKAAAEPDGDAGRYKGKTLAELLASDEWDYVTLQQYSWLSHDPSTHQPYADRLVEHVREHAPQADLLVHQTWAYRVDDPRFTGEDWKPGHPRTHEAMYEQVAAAYEKLARDVGAEIVPVGDAFYRADTDPQWGYRPDESFDFASAQPPALPDQTHSLHTGWRWVKNKEGDQVLRIDGHHAGLAGQYLAGCVFYEVLFDESVVGNPFIPEGMDPAYARFLQETAHETVAARRAAVSATR